MKTSVSTAPAWGGVLLAGALWGGGAVVAQYAMERGVNAHSLALGRFVLGLPLLWWWHWRQRPAAPGGAATLSRHERGTLVAIGAAMALNVSCWFAGIALLGAALPTVISICCAPVLVALVSVLRGYEPLSARLLAALVLALAGVALISMPEQGWLAGQLPANYLAGIGWSLASAALYAAVVLGNARLPAHVPAATASAWGMTAAALCMAGVVAWQGLTWPVDAGAWLAVTYTGVVTTSVAYLLFAWGARRLGPTATAVGILVEPLAATVLGAWLLAQALSQWQAAGALLLGCAILLLAWHRRGEPATGGPG